MVNNLTWKFREKELYSCDDLRQEGYIAIINAAEKFKICSQRSRFRLYAYFLFRREIDEIYLRII